MNVMFYDKVSLLSKKIHKDLSIEQTSDFAFAKDTNSIALLAVEFTKAAKEYPIIFVKNGDYFFSAALLGLRDNENLFIQKSDTAGVWNADYMPAYIRRYPFIPVSRGKHKKLTIGIDENYSGFNYSNKGERLFTGDGQPGSCLKQTMKFLNDYQEQHRFTIDFCKAVNELSLLEQVTLNAELNSGEKLSLAGLFTINRQRLAALETEQIEDLFRKGYLELIFSHLLSMDNFEKLMARM
jgi:hypothetical protein